MVDPAEEDSALARRLGAFVVEAADALAPALGQTGGCTCRLSQRWPAVASPFWVGWMEQCPAWPCSLFCKQPGCCGAQNKGLGLMGCPFCLPPSPSPRLCAAAAALPADVRAMLAAGRWCNTAFGWTVAAAGALQEAAAAETAAAAATSAKPEASRSSGSTSSAAAPSAASAASAAGAAAATRKHDATAALQLARAAVAALALVSDVGFEAAVRYLSQEYYHVASMVRSCREAAVGCQPTASPVANRQSCVVPCFRDTGHGLEFLLACACHAQ
jgi:hypothetical protein